LHYNIEVDGALFLGSVTGNYYSSLGATPLLGRFIGPEGTKSVTVGGDIGFDTRGFLAECRNLGVVPHVAQNLGRNVGARLMAAPRGTWDTSSAKRRGSGSKNALAG